MNGLPTGLYQPGTSVIHRLTPVVKLLCLLLILAAVICTETIMGYGICLLLAGGLVYLSRMGMAVALSSVKRLKWFFVLIFLMNLCFYGPENPWIRLWIFQPSYEGMMQGIHVVMRVFLLLIFSNVLTVTTAPLELTGAIETLLSPLRLFRIPVGQIAMILSVAMQFIPTLFEETDMIRKAQMARGARFDSRKLLDKAAAVMPLVVPIFLAAFKRADELSLAMEARGYRTDVPLRMRRGARWKKADWIGVMLCLAYLALTLSFV